MTRFTINERCELVAEDGSVLGRLVAIELELLDPRRGVLSEPNQNNNNVKSNSNVKSKEPFGKESRAPSQQVQEVWAHYLAVLPSQRRLGAKQQRDIERALEVCAIQVVKDAISGLANSPHHNGHNDTGTKYLDIRYALRGNPQRGETPEERIERMAQLAHSMAVETTTRDRGVAEGMISQLKTDVRRCWVRDARDPQPTEEKLRRRDEAIQALYGHGIMVRLGEDGQPFYEDIA